MSEIKSTALNGLEIVGIRDAGELQKERLLLRATEPVRLDYYIVTNVKVVGDKVNILNDKVFWFPPFSVNQGEYVRLYTKSGSYSKENGKFGEQPAVYHNFFWQLNAPIWNVETSNGLTVFKVNSWNTAQRD